ncbi:alpha-ketoacid dehydrogenase subunit beta [Amycolatopsis keratiniphila]|uniref:Alpha-ketoacid dehydrogenase subunit beta n=1 Tax=Amycolatopsis keratiniphila subsp. keratiniphila TaxID=227715 RepID=A0A1W2M469_9PSEU|nr:transketolase C-terminal domain-containing protein [Amycolatopsis keratiniphila]ONF75004.1 alpha-ketoacid dehydrogenase subunit beta [Amycolatopsis keratiniphila subsp. keratiniphila]
MTARVVENLNTGLRTVLDADERLYVLGEDIADPYGGAFKVTRGLSAAHPERVRSTPISEGAIVGTGAGLALAGDKAIVEMMFGDFVALAFDQIVNFASRSVSMYGRRIPLHLVIRCPVGGGRGYGPTHSGSPQKHFIGVPGLSLFEMSAFHDNTALLERALGLGHPAILFEDKVLYTRRMHDHDPIFHRAQLGTTDPCARFTITGADTPDCVLIAPGGVAERALAAARSLLLSQEIVCEVLVPSRLYPFDLEPLLPALAAGRRVCVIEESTAGGTWGSDIAHQIHTALWDRLAAPVRLVHSADAIIPAAPHLEQEVLVGTRDIVQAVEEVTSQ